MTMETFIDRSTLEAIVPVSDQFSLEAALCSWDGALTEQNPSILPFVTQRQMLFFDELVPVFVVLRAPTTEYSTVKEYLAKLDILLEAYAVGAPPPNAVEGDDGQITPSVSPKEMLHSEILKESNEPLIFSEVPSSKEGIKHDWSFVVWKATVRLIRPKSQMFKPAVYFSASASVKLGVNIEIQGKEEEYLPSNVPEPLNILQPFASDSSLSGMQPRLSALRISKFTPTSKQKEALSPIKSGAKRLFKAMPILLWRMRYSRWQASADDMAVFASLHLEAYSYAPHRISVDHVNFKLTDGEVEECNPPAQDQGIPLVAGDQSILLYKLRPNPNRTLSSIRHHALRTLDLNITAQVYLSEDCCPAIDVEWKTDIDFGPGPMREGQAQQIDRPTGQGGLEDYIKDTPIAQHKPPGPDTLPQSESEKVQGGANPKVDNISISLTISGPQSVKVGEIFAWTVFIVNRSEQQRKLTLFTIPRRKQPPPKLEKEQSAPSIPNVENADEIIDAVLDGNVVYTQQKNAKLDFAELISLNTDVRVGPLAPAACYTAELKFLAVSPGVLSVEALRVVDLATHEAMDIRDLPSIIVVPDPNNFGK